jgi:alpha-L-rhamnosidase
MAKGSRFRRHLGVAAVLPLLVVSVSAESTSTPAAPARDPGQVPGGAQQWERYVETPAQENVRPVRSQAVEGQVENPDALVTGRGVTTLVYRPGEAEPAIVLDYGKDVGGIPEFQVSSVSGTPTLQAGYSEGLPYVSPEGDYGGPGLGHIADPSRSDTFVVSKPGLVTNGLIQGGERYEEVVLTTPGTLSISGAWIQFTALRATPAQYKGWFLSSSNELNRLWYQGAYTVQLDSVPANTGKPNWTVSDGSLLANGGNIAVLKSGSAWTNYSMTFRTEILDLQSGWVVRSTSNASEAYLFILDDSTDTQGPPNSVQELVYDNGAYQRIATAPVGETIAAGTWHDIGTTVSGATVTVSVDGKEVSSFTAGGSSGIPLLSAGTVGFREYEGDGEEARFADLAVDGQDGAVLFSNTLSEPSALSFFSGQAVVSPDPLPLILDGAKRDRVVWAGDLGVEGPTVFYSTDARQYVKGSEELLNSYQTAQGELGTNINPSAPLGTFPENDSPYSTVYSLDELNNIAAYYLYTGDRSFLVAQWPAVERELGYVQGLTNSAGLLVTNGSNGRDWDYYDGAKTGVVTAYNVIYYEALVNAAKMARALGHATEAATYEGAATQLRSAINANLFDPSTGLYEVSTSKPGTFAQDANSLAVLYGVAPTNAATKIIETLRKSLVETPYGPEPFSASTGYSPDVSPFVTNEEVEALFARRESTQAVSLLETLWGYMDTPGLYYTGADWEALTPAGAPAFGSFTSLAHGWASGPTADLSAFVLGVRPTAAGYRAWSIDPHPGGLTWAEGQVPTPSGPINAEWRALPQGGFTVMARTPAGEHGVITVQVPAGGTATLTGRSVTGQSVRVRVGPERQASAVGLPVANGGSYRVIVSG